MFEQYTNKKIKFNFGYLKNNMFIPYDYICTTYDNCEFLKKYTIQQINIIFQSYNKIANNIHNYITYHYDIIYNLYTYVNIKKAYNEYKQILPILKNNNINIYFTYEEEKFKIKINTFDDFYKYFIIDNVNRIIGIKYPKLKLNRNTYIYYISIFKQIHEIHKIRKSNLDYLDNYITKPDYIKNYLLQMHSGNACAPHLLNFLSIIKMYKYKVKNIHEDVLNIDVVLHKLILNYDINKKIINDIFNNKKYYKYRNMIYLHDCINELILY